MRYISKLWHTCKDKDIALDLVGLTGKKDEHLLLKIVLNKRSKRAVCFTAGIHGDERSGPWGVLDFISRYKHKKGDPEIVILPLLNPHGFERKSYSNHQGLNLNRHFLDHIVHEDVELVYSSLKNHDIEIFVAFHEDDVMDGFYLYGYSKGDKSVFHKIAKFMSTRWKICEREIIYGDKAKKGIIHYMKKDPSFEGKMFADGVHYATCIEFPDRIPFKQRVQFVADTMFYIVDLVKKM